MSLKGLRLAVAGAGVLGLAIATRAARAGARVELFEPRALGDNASGVAAGMLSPTLEAALEGVGPERYGLYRRGYAAWPAFAAACSLQPLPQLGAGALYVGTADELEALHAKLETLDVRVEALDAAAVRTRQALYDGDLGALWVQADGRVDPIAVLLGLRQAFEAAGGRWRPEALAPERVGRTHDAVVLAAGFETAHWRGLAPELAVLTPIKGHILRYPLADASGPTLRNAHGYLAPLTGGAAFGASMEPGLSDAGLDPAIIEALHRQAVALAPALAGLPYSARTGVRAATPDGAPLVGRSQGGMVLAVGARRNGWLLAPLVAEATLAALQGAAADPAFDPGRFAARSIFERSGHRFAGRNA